MLHNYKVYDTPVPIDFSRIRLEFNASFSIETYVDYGYSRYHLRSRKQEKKGVVASVEGGISSDVVREGSQNSLVRKSHKGISNG
jgi:hypothetical protein